MATRAYDWQRLASPAPSSSSESGFVLGPGSHQGPGAQRAYAVDPFHGSYPSAPHLRPIELPETDSPTPGFVSLGYNGSTSGSSRSRPMSLPPPEGLGIYGIPSPPTSTHSSHSGGSTGSSGPVVHPLLRGSASLTAQLAYNILRAPSTHGSHALRTSQGARVTSNDLAVPATHPPCSALSVSVFIYPGGPNGARRFMWDVTLTPSRRASAPPPPNAPSPVSLGDALASLHLFLCAPVSESELRQFHVHDVQSARVMCAARRAAYPNSPPSIVRADFLYGCTEFAGFVRSADNSFAVRLLPPSTMA